MGIFTKLFPRQSVDIATGGYLNMITGYRPQFTSFDGGVYEAALCRAAIHTFATQVSKLRLEGVGTAERVHKLLAKPNEWQTPSQFLYQLATILECQNTAFIFPVLDSVGEEIVALYAINPQTASVVEDTRGKLWLKCQLVYGRTGLVELDRVGILTKYQYKSLFFGSGDNPLRPTLDLIHAQNEGIVEGVKNSATIRFLAKIGQTLKPADLEAERKRFVTSNLSSANNGGVMMFDAKYTDVKQVTSTPYTVDAAQMKIINENVYSYFGVNENILQNKFSEDEWNGYYEGRIEPFAIQLSEVLTAQLYTERELGFGNYVLASANRLQYASNKTKLDVVTQLLDRGMLTPNEGREIFNMPGFGEEGDVRYIRLDYTEADNLNAVQSGEEEEENNAD